MTTEDAAKLAHSFGIHIHPCSPGNPRIQGHLAELAALIAEVRRQAMEECLLVCKESDYFGDVYDVIRARLEEGK